MDDEKYIFKAFSTANPDAFLKILLYIDDQPFLAGFERGLLKGLCQYTPNPKFFEGISKLSSLELCDIAVAFYEAIKSLRGWGGGKSGESRRTTPSGTPKGRRSRSVSDTPTPCEPQETTPSGEAQKEFNLDVKSVDFKLENPRVLKLQEDDKTEVIEKSQQPVPDLGSYMGLFGVTNPLPSGDILVDKSAKRRDPNFSKYCIDRQKEICAVSAQSIADNDNPRETAHLFPYSAFWTEDEKSIALWKYLAIFLGEEKRDKLVEVLISSGYGVHIIANRLAMEVSMHRIFDEGGFFLRPTGNHGNNWMEADMIWVASHETLKSKQTFFSPNPKDQFPPHRLLEFPRPVKPIETIRFFTTDADNLPLPSAVLMRWHELSWKTITACGLSETQAMKTKRIEDLKARQNEIHAHKRKRALDEAIASAGKSMEESSDSSGLEERERKIARIGARRGAAATIAEQNVDTTMTQTDGAADEYDDDEYDDDDDDDDEYGGAYGYYGGQGYGYDEDELT